jgi:hypothetical protein
MNLIIVNTHSTFIRYSAKLAAPRAPAQLMAHVSNPDVTSVGDLISIVRNWQWRTKYAVIADKDDADGRLPELKQPDTPQSSQRKALLPFVIISISYMIYTFTDGAVRMIVLLAAYNKGFNAMEVAVMFTLYETAGVVTNLLAGLAGAKWGLKMTHCSGLSLQLVGLGMLCGWKVAQLYLAGARALSPSPTLFLSPSLASSRALSLSLPPFFSLARSPNRLFSHLSPVRPCRSAGCV